MCAHRIVQSAAFAGAILALAGCRTPGPPVDAPVETWLPPGRVAIVAARQAPEIPSTANATGRRAAASDAPVDYVEMGLAGAQLALMVPYIYYAPVLLPITALAGGIAIATFGVIQGAWYGLPEEQAKALQQLIVAALGDPELHEGLARNLARLDKQFPRYSIEHLRDDAPAGGAESVLGIAVTSIGFHAARVRPPAAVLQMKASARLVRAGERGEPRVLEFTHTSDLRSVPDWLAGDGRLLREQIAVGQFLLADRIAQAAFRRN